MCPRKESQPYFELGQLIKLWRSEKYRSALQLFKESHLSFSYSLYADFERGAVLPSPHNLLELADLFEKDVKLALLLWARVQMPNDSLREFFRRPFSPEPPPVQNSEISPNVDNTWILGMTELRMLTKYPWIWNVIMTLVAAYPEGVEIDDLPLPFRVSKQRFLEEILVGCLNAGAIVKTQNRLRVRQQHVHLPRTEDWDEFRKENLQRAFEDLRDAISLSDLRTGTAYRELISRPLTPRQVERWSAELKKLENEFKSDPYVVESQSSSDQVYSLVILLGPSRLTKKN